MVKPICIFVLYVLLCRNFCLAQHTYGNTIFDNKSAPELKVLLNKINQDIKAAPGDDENYITRITIYLKLGDTLTALKESEQIIERSPKYWKTYAQLGTIKAAKGDWDGAEKNYDQAITLEPANPVAYNNKGYLLYLRKNYSGSVFFYDKAIQADSAYAEAYNNKMDALYALGNIEELEATCNLLVSKFKNEPKAYIHRAEFYTSQRKYSQALEDYNRAAALETIEFGVFWTEKIKFLDNIGKDQQAIDECNLAIAAKPKNYFLYYLRSRSELDLYQYRNVVNDCNRSLALNKNYYAAYVMLGSAYASLGKNDSSTTSLNLAIKCNPVEEEAYLQKCITQIEEKNYAQALATIDAYIKNDPAFKHADIYKPAAILMQRGDLNTQLKNYNEALKDYTKAIAFAENNSKLWIKKGETLLFLNDKAEACKAFEQAGALGDGSARANLVLNCR